MLKPKSPQESFYGSYLYERIVPSDHLLRQINQVVDYTSISYFRIQRLGEEKFQSVLEQIVRQCIDKGLVKGKRQIIDSTPIIANISSSSITGLVRKCRENVLKTVNKQDTGIAAKLGVKELQAARSVR